MRKKSLMLAAVLAAGVMMAACGSASTLPDNSQESQLHHSRRKVSIHLN